MSVFPDENSMGVQRLGLARDVKQTHLQLNIGQLRFLFGLSGDWVGGHAWVLPVLRVYPRRFSVLIQLAFGGGTHPVFALAGLKGGVGFKLPVSKPFRLG